MARAANAVEEVSFAVDVNGARIAHWTASPEQMRELCTGFLFARGYIDAIDDLLSLDVAFGSTGGAVASARVSDDGMKAGERLKRERRDHGLEAAPTEPARERPDSALPEDLSESFRELFGSEDSGRDTAGLHTAGAWLEGRLCFVTYEIGRHNAVDKVIGAALIARAPLETAGLLLTARISGEIAMKAARAGTAWIASRSVPTTLAVQIARSAGIAIIARAAGRERHVFHAHDRA